MLVIDGLVARSPAFMLARGGQARQHRQAVNLADLHGEPGENAFASLDAQRRDPYPPAQLSKEVRAIICLLLQPSPTHTCNHEHGSAMRNCQTLVRVRCAAGLPSKPPVVRLQILGSKPPVVGVQVLGFSIWVVDALCVGCSYRAQARRLGCVWGCVARMRPSASMLGCRRCTPSCART